MSDDRAPERIGLPPAFAAFLDRTLSRTLPFVVLRECDGRNKRCVGWHKHADRPFYRLSE